MQLFPGMRGGLRGLHIASGAYARIGKILFHKRLKGGAVYFLAFGLHKLFVPVETKPFQVFDGLRGSAGLVFGMIQILHAKDEASAKRTRPKPCDHECPDVAEVKRACWTWR